MLIYLMTIFWEVFFFSHRPFHGFNIVFFVGGPNPLADIDRGAKTLTYPQIRSAIITLSALEGGKLHCQLRWRGHGRIGPPWIHLWLYVVINSERCIPHLHIGLLESLIDCGLIGNDAQALHIIDPGTTIIMTIAVIEIQSNHHT